MLLRRKINIAILYICSISEIAQELFNFHEQLIFCFKYILMSLPN